MTSSQTHLQIEDIIDDLKSIAPIALDEAQNRQLVYAEKLYREGDTTETRIAENTLRTLYSSARQVERGDFEQALEVELVGQPDASGLYRTLEAERASTSATLSSMGQSFKRLAVCSAAVITALCAFVIDRTDMVKAPWVCDLSLLIAAAYFGYLLHTQARLVQNAREADERMQLRSALGRALAKAMSSASARGDFRLLDRLMLLMPHHDSEHSRTLGPEDLRAWLHGLARLNDHNKRSEGITGHDDECSTAT